MSVFSHAIRDFLAAPEDERRLGPYRCKKLLDEAGSAPVFRAMEEHAGRSLRDVAVKLFDIGTTADTAATTIEDGARVIDEARSLCRVQHPNVVRFHTLVTDPKRGLMGLVMEFVEGSSLDRELKELPRDDARRVALAVDIGINIASALAAAHEAGIVHCNVKPSNIMLTEGTHKLINFGIAGALRQTIYPGERAGLNAFDLPAESIGKRAAALDTSGDDAGAPIAGTIGYVDPICVKTTTPPSSSSDLYSLGATLYECLAGDVPACATSKKNGGQGVDKKILVGSNAATPIAEVAPSTPPDLAKLVDALVAPKREARPRSADAVRHALERVRSALAGHERALPPLERGPFPGLAPYEAADRDVFFGRDAEIAGVIELARTRGLVGIMGAAGSGKSSLARAGALPAIEEGALGGWPTRYRSVLVNPGANLMAALDTALSTLLGAPLAEHPEAIAQQLAANVDAKGEGIVVLVDQFEEIVTLHEAAHEKGRLDGLDLLSRLSDAAVGVRVIVVARRDFLDSILAIDPRFVRALSRAVLQLGPLSSTAWEEVIDKSLEAYGYAFEDTTLRQEVLSDVTGHESAMPLVQFGLARLWAARADATKCITRAGFSAKNGMRGALEAHADTTIAAVEIPRGELRELLLAMTTPEGTRSHLLPATLVKRFGEAGRESMMALATARLVIEEKAGFTFVHDSVLRDWSLLRDGISDARDDRLLVAHVERDATRWSESRDAAELWRKGRLASGIELWKRGVPLSDAAREFLTKSVRDEQKVQRAIWSLASLVVLLIVGGSLFYAKESSERATQARRDADALTKALADVKVLEHQAQENAFEATASAALLHDLQKKMAAERNAYGAQVQDAMKKVASATNLDGAQKATQDLKSQGGPAQNQVVPVPLDLSSVNSPRAPALDTSGPSPSGGAGTFDQGAIERVVNSRKAGVKRTCLDRSTSTASSSKVTATITIAPSGAVQNVSTTGDEPVVAKCIEQQLRTWSFPAPGETKQVQIPFVFVRQ